MRAVGLGALGSTAIVSACVPKVSATIVIDESRPPVHQQREPSDRAEGSKPGTGRDRLSPGIIRAELVAGNRLRIHFSEAIAPRDEVDPRDFRISFLRLYLNQGSLYSYAYYYDPGTLYYGSPLVHSEVRISEDQLEFEFSPEISSEFCREIEYEYSSNYDAPGVQSEAGLFLHYAAGRIPIQDAAGNPMRNFGADWVARGRLDPPESRLQLNGAAAHSAGADLVRIACGPPIPPGPG